MKKTTLFLIGLLLASIPSLADTRASILLLHNGQGKSFDADQLQQAVSEAVSGDTINLSEGAFILEESLKLDKDVHIIGAGAKTCKVVGDIDVSIEGNPELVGNLIEAIKIEGSVSVSKGIKKLSMRKCWVSNQFFAADDIEAANVQISSCYIKEFCLRKPIKAATVINSVIHRQGYHDAKSKDKFVEGHDVSFVNCSIYSLDAECDLAATYQNCIIFHSTSGQPIKNNTFINTLFSVYTGEWYMITSERVVDTNTAHNCYWHSFQADVDRGNDYFPSFEIDSEVLLSNGFLGIDETIVGANGGSTPYTLEADGISIKESILKVDPDTRQLNVTLKIAAE